MRIRVKKSNSIYGKDGALPVGAELDVKAVPNGWSHFVEIVGDDPKPEAVAVLNAPIAEDLDEITGLRVEYETLTGETADKRWKEETLHSKIAAAKAD